MPSIPDRRGDYHDPLDEYQASLDRELIDSAYPVRERLHVPVVNDQQPPRGANLKNLIYDDFMAMKERYYDINGSYVEYDPVNKRARYITPNVLTSSGDPGVVVFHDERDRKVEQRVWILDTIFTFEHDDANVWLKAANALDLDVVVSHIDEPNKGFYAAYGDNNRLCGSFDRYAGRGSLNDAPEMSMGGADVIGATSGFEQGPNPCSEIPLSDPKENAFQPVPDSHFDSGWNRALRANSGEFQSSDPFVSFLYELLRDHVPATVVETVLRNSARPGVTRYCNGHLAKYAEYVANTLHESKMAFFRETNSSIDAK